jgi:hypothetical protein
MTNAATLIDLNTRIAAIRENISELIEQAAAYSGGSGRDRTAGRIAEHEAQLALGERDTLEGVSSAAENKKLT